MTWLVRGDEVLASAEIAVTRKQRRSGLLGRESLEGVLVLRPCRLVHTFGMRFDIDVVFCDRDGFVLHTQTVKRNRLSRLVPRAFFAIEAPAGFNDRWGIAPGDLVEVKA